MRALLGVGVVLLLTVIISVTRDPIPRECVTRDEPQVKMVKTGNTYKRIETPGKASVTDCPAVTTSEEWTDLPENGGTFVRPVRDVNR
jgi:hypothetical protein